MTLLIPMRPGSYPAYLAAAIAGYAQDNVAVGRWPQAGAAERSRADFESLLPLGLATPDNHLFEMLVAEDGPAVGMLWLAIERKHGFTSGFVYDVEVQPAHRRQGHALRAFRALEPIAAALGATSIGLHVFGSNAPAQALYRRLGYGVTGVNMLKLLGDDMG